MVKSLTVVLGGFVIGLLIAAAFSIPAWLLWNWLMPAIFGLPKVGFLQMLGLATLLRLLIPTATGSKE